MFPIWESENQASPLNQFLRNEILVPKVKFHSIEKNTISVAKP